MKCNPEAIMLLAALKRRQETWRPEEMAMDCRDLEDVIVGRQRFRMPRIPFAFTVERGVVVSQGFPDSGKLQHSDFDWDGLGLGLSP
jgi:hypothetical protein